MAVLTWSWLGDHLAVDVANTVRRHGTDYVELIAVPADLDEWLTREADRLQRPKVVDQVTVEGFREVRDRCLRLLRAAAAGAQLQKADVTAINTVAVAVPTIRLLTTTAGSGVTRRGSSGDDVEDLVADLAFAVIDLLTRPDLAHVALCDAPSCGQLFHRERPNQQWCNPACGDRVRSARHHQRRRNNRPSQADRSSGRGAGAR